jgi:hypothetical protein
MTEDDTYNTLRRCSVQEIMQAKWFADIEDDDMYPEHINYYKANLAAHNWTFDEFIEAYNKVEEFEIMVVENDCFVFRYAR